MEKLGEGGGGQEDSQAESSKAKVSFVSRVYCGIKERRELKHDLHRKGCKDFNESKRRRRRSEAGLV